jgi:glycosyltransferase involved in cell wall biosynthesis
LKIAFFFENYVTGGGSKYAADCISICTSLNHEALVLANTEAFSALELASFSNLVQIRNIFIFERTQLVLRHLGEGVLPSIIRKAMIFLVPLFLCLNVVNICRFLISSRPSLLISCNGGYPGSEASLAAVIAADLLKVKSLLIIMSDPRSRRIYTMLYETILDRAILAHHRQIVVNSKKQKSSLIKLRGARPANITAVYNGISDYEFDFTRPLKSLQSEFLVGVVCRLDRQKGVDDLIQAFAGIEIPDNLRLLIIGDGSYRPTLSNLCQQLKVSEKVLFLGFKHGVELEKAYQTLDLFVLPSHWEGLPYGILEAMRAGLPIIATDVGGVSEAIRHEVEGLLVPPRSPDALKDAILRLYAHPDQASRFGIAARNRYKNLFTKDIMREAFSRLL